MKDNLNISNENKNKRRRIFLIAGALAVVLAGSAILAAATGNLGLGTISIMGKRDAKSIIFEALSSNIFSEKESAFDEVFGTDILKLAETKSMETGFRFAIQSADDIPQLDALSGSEIFADILNDVNTKKASGTFGIGTGGMNLFDANFYTDSKNLMISLPQYSGKLFTVDLTKDLKKQIADSYIAGKLGIDPGAVISLQTLSKEIQNIISGGVPGLDILQIVDKYENSPAVKTFKDSIEALEVEPKNFIVNGKEVQCKGYEMKASQPNIIAFLRAITKEIKNDTALKEDISNLILQLYRISNDKTYTEEEINQKAQQIWTDFDAEIPPIIDMLEAHMRCMVMDVYIDGSGNIVSLDGLTAYILDDIMTMIRIEMDNSGGYTPDENMELVVTVENDEKNSKLYLAKSGNSNASILDSAVQFGIEDDGKNIFSVNLSGKYSTAAGDYRLSFFCNDEESQVIYFSSSGKIKDFVKATQGNIDIDSLLVVSRGNEIVDLSGTFYFKPLTKEIKPLTGTPFDLLGASEAEWDALFQEAAKKIMPLINSVESLLN